MPAAIAHELFGEDILAQLGEKPYPTRDEQDAFLLGNQGPDPLFYLFVRSSNIEARRMGSTLHREAYAAFIQSMIDFLGIIRTEELGVAQAYVAGYLCHYALDSLAHPYIHWFETRLVESGVPGIEDAAPQIHGQIESDLDSYLLWQWKGIDVYGYRPFADMLEASDRVLRIVDRIYCFAAAGACKVILEPDTFSRAVRSMRRMQRVFYSPRGVKRTLLGKVERIAVHHSLAQAMSHSARIHGVCDWDNRDHGRWVNLYTGERSTASFMDIVDHARMVALDDLQKFTDGRPATEMTRGINLLGEPDDDQPSQPDAHRPQAPRR